MTSSGGGSPIQTGCVGTQYTVRGGDSCTSVSNSQGISTASLLAANNIASCSSFPTSGDLCIPDSAKCKVYTVQSSDTCATIADANSLTWTQIVTWNTVVGKNCANIAAAVGNQVCVSAPGGGWANPSPTAPDPTTNYR
jgi:LysM repeat protein